MSALLLSAPADAESPPCAAGPSGSLPEVLAERVDAVGTRAVDGIAMPQADVAALACGDRPVMVFARDLYIPPKDERTAARSPEQALQRLLVEGYPNVPVDQLASIHELSASDRVTKFSFASGGRLQASFVTEGAGGEFRVSSWAICEATAQRWGR